METLKLSGTMRVINMEAKPNLYDAIENAKAALTKVLEAVTFSQDREDVYSMMAKFDEMIADNEREE